MPKTPQKLEDIELHPDAWDRFEKFVKKAIPTSRAPKAKRTASRAKAASRKRRKSS
jgi:hypothetical protein